MSSCMRGFRQSTDALLHSLRNASKNARSMESSTATTRLFVSSTRWAAHHAGLTMSMSILQGVSSPRRSTNVL